jgi:thiamine-monophosphate kinase
MTSEFSLIERFFTRPTPSASLGVGDDAALLALSPGMELAISTDMLVAGTHFFPDTDPRKLGWKTLAVNISDLAAMGAQPRWATLALALPQVDETWLAAFSDGFFKCAGNFGIELIGGDTTRGPLNLSVTILGEVPINQALRRDAARPGDDIWVSGTLGAAALGLATLQKRVQLGEVSRSHCLRALETPQPRVALGLALRGIAHVAIDISDGLLADLGHILECSGCGAEVFFNDLPRSDAVDAVLSMELGRRCLLAGGDDYELCFTVPPDRCVEVDALSQQLQLPLTRVGRVVEHRGLKLLDVQGRPIKIEETGFDHFA